MRKRVKALVVSVVLAGAAVLGGCTGGSAPSDVDAAAIAGEWQLSGFEDSAQSMGAEDLAANGFTASMTLKDDGTFELDGYPGAWEKGRDGHYTFTVDTSADQQSDDQSSEQSSETVFTATVDGDRLRLATNGLTWIFERAGEGTSQSK